MSRIEREKQTVLKMIELYCRHRHAAVDDDFLRVPNQLCRDSQSADGIVE